MRKDKLRKRMGLASGLLLLTLVIFGGYYKYQVEKSYTTLVPANATAMIRVDVYGLFKSMLGDLLKQKRGASSRVQGVSLPANIFIYSISNQEGCWFTSLPLSKPAVFSKSLLALGFRQQPGNSDTLLFLNETKTCSVAQVGSHAAIAFTPKRQDVATTLKAILRANHFVEVNDSHFKAIRNLHGHITFMSAAGNGSLSFGKGTVQLKANIELQQWNSVVPGSYSTGGDEAILHFWCYTDWKPFLSGQTFRIGDMVIPGDSLLQFGLKGMELSVGKPLMQEDTVITYEYNDNFEKVPQVSVRQVQVPYLYCRIMSTEPLLLSRYLDRQHIISGERKIDRKAFPLYQLFVTDSTGSFSVSTSQGVLPGGTTARDTATFLSLDADFRQLVQLPDMQLLGKYAGWIDRLQLRGSREKTGRLQINGVLECTDKSRSSFLTLLKVIR